MIKNFLHAVLFITLGFMSIFSTFAIVVNVPENWAQPDIIVPVNQIDDSVASESSLFTTIQTVNSYLRFSMWVICMWVLIYWWIKLITAQWDSAKMKEANKLLMWALIGILIVIFSYALVKIIVNLL